MVHDILWGCGCNGYGAFFAVICRWEKKVKKKWCLGSFFLVLIAYIYFVESKGAEKKQAANDAKERVLVFNKEDVESIILKNTYGTYEAKRIGEDEWMLEKPLKVKADKNALSNRGGGGRGARLRRGEAGRGGEKYEHLGGCAPACSHTARLRSSGEAAVGIV